MRPFVFGMRVDAVDDAGIVDTGDGVGVDFGSGDGACGFAGAAGNTPPLGLPELPP